MSLPRCLQLLGFVIVTAVLVGALFVGIDDMTFEFGGLGLGAVVFLLGKALERPSAV